MSAFKGMKSLLEESEKENKITKKLEETTEIVRSADHKHAIKQTRIRYMRSNHECMIYKWEYSEDGGKTFKPYNWVNGQNYTGLNGEPLTDEQYNELVCAKIITPIIEKKCECGKDKHGFASHSPWCPKYEEGKNE